MFLEKEIRQREGEFLALCNRYKVSKLYAFGSAISDRFNENSSDIDLLVEVSVSDPIEKGETLFALWDSLEAFFRRKVDLLTEKSLKNPYLRKDIEQTRKLIYDRTAEKILV
jgi:hypothetical protein